MLEDSILQMGGLLLRIGALKRNGCVGEALRELLEVFWNGGVEDVAESFLETLVRTRVRIKLYVDLPLDFGGVGDSRSVRVDFVGAEKWEVSLFLKVTVSQDVLLLKGFPAGLGVKDEEVVVGEVFKVSRLRDGEFGEWFPWGEVDWRWRELCVGGEWVVVRALRVEGSRVVASGGHVGHGEEVEAVVVIVGREGGVVGGFQLVGRRRVEMEVVVLNGSDVAHGAGGRRRRGFARSECEGRGGCGTGVKRMGRRNAGRQAETVDARWASGQDVKFKGRWLGGNVSRSLSPTRGRQA